MQTLERILILSWLLRIDVLLSCTLPLRFKHRNRTVPEFLLALFEFSDKELNRFVAVDSRRGDGCPGMDVKSPDSKPTSPTAAGL